MEPLNYRAWRSKKKRERIEELRVIFGDPATLAKIIDVQPNTVHGWFNRGSMGIDGARAIERVVGGKFTEAYLLPMPSEWFEYYKAAKHGKN